jgi:hypothetical protein
MVQAIVAASHEQGLLWRFCMVGWCKIILVAGGTGSLVKVVGSGSSKTNRFW